MNEKMISLVMIVKNEEDRIKSCLNSASGLVDEMIVVDTGSTDNTKLVAEQCGAKLFDHEWSDDFSEARNFALQKASGEWVLQLDGDEELDADAPQIIKGALLSPNSDVFGLQIIDLAGSETFHLPRLFRNNMFKYQGIVHEVLVDKSLDINVPTTTAADLALGVKKITMLNLPAKIMHFGYSSTDIKIRDKFNRNITMLKKASEEDPDDMQTLFYLGATYQSAGQLDEAVRYYRQVISSPDKTRFPIVFKNLTRTYESLNDLASAIEVAEEGVKLFPAYKALWFHLGIANYLSKNYSGAAVSFMQCLKGPDDTSMPTSVPGIQILSKLFLALSKLEVSKEPETVNQIDTLMALLAVDSEALFYLGKTYINAYGAKKAQTELSRIADLNNSDVKQVFEMLF